MENFIEIVNIDYENVDSISLEEIVAFKYAYFEALGEEGSIYFLSNKNGLKYYYINFIYSDKKIINRVFKGFFKPFADHILEHNYLFYDNFEGWKDYYTSKGNYIFLRQEYVDKFEKIGNSYPKGIVQDTISRRNIDKFFYETFIDVR